MLTIGIPRALHYYKYFPLWLTFFQELGFSVISSPETNRLFLERGISRLVSDNCIPLKAYAGHALWLADRCDILFIPVLRSIEPKVYNCSRFLGLADLIKVAVPELKKVVEFEMDVNRGATFGKKQLQKLSRELDISPDKVHKAYAKAMLVHQQYLSSLHTNRLTYQEGISLITKADIESRRNGHDAAITVGLLGHPYVLNDDYINHNLIQRTQKAGVRIITPEMIPEELLQKGVQSLVDQSYWTSETEVIGAAGAYLGEKVDGVIGVTAFSCGPDSLMMSVVKHQVSVEHNTPFLCLTVDEHSSETGMITRLEAFLEMIVRKKRKS
jgi:predicted nucleotide-binding protein (sugar kinase/HSP70/actin superfamily)